MTLRFIYRNIMVLTVAAFSLAATEGLCASANDSPVRAASPASECQPECQPQKERRFSPEEYVKKCDAFMIAEAKLTPAEARKFFPLYHEMKDKQRRCEFEKGRLERSAMKQLPSDKECQRILQRINELNKQIQNIEESYQKKLLRTVSASKLLSAKIAEKKFERRMLRNMVHGPRKE